MYGGKKSLKDFSKEKIRNLRNLPADLWTFYDHDLTFVCVWVCQIFRTAAGIKQELMVISFLGFAIWHKLKLEMKIAWKFEDFFSFWPLKSPRLQCFLSFQSDEENVHCCCGSEIWIISQFNVSKWKKEKENCSFMIISSPLGTK